MLLKIKSNTDEIKNLYVNHGTYHKGDSGIDLFIPEDIIIKSKSMGTTIDMKISCEALKDNTNQYVNNIRKVFINNTTDDLRKLVNEIRDIDIKYVNCSYYLYPRSSISKTPLRMSNGTGIIDAGYRGNIIAKVDNISDNDYKIEKGTRLFQLCDASLDEIEIKIVDELSSTSRGESGFGSTN
uniref:dUTP diphosphatase n=1 Tax=viral metagenome TaxID=1070528 RepID=A0A6C0CYT8_9ZZZZ